MTWPQVTVWVELAAKRKRLEKANDLTVQSYAAQASGKDIKKLMQSLLKE